MAELSRIPTVIAHRMKVDFVTSMSYEFRSPLRGILANVEYLQTEEELPIRQADHINTIVRPLPSAHASTDPMLEFLWTNAAGHHQSCS
jgi:hypothetical protein